MREIIVKGLAGAATEAQLVTLFRQHGAVHSVRVMRDWFTGRPLGFAIVEMESVGGAQAAIAALDGQALEGRRLTVSVFHKRY